MCEWGALHRPEPKMLEQNQMPMFMFAAPLTEGANSSRCVDESVGTMAQVNLEIMLNLVK